VPRKVFGTDREDAVVKRRKSDVGPAEVIAALKAPVLPDM
jgi:hypothetical protein